MNFSQKISPNTHLYQALTCYEQLVLLNAKIYQKLLRICFKEFKIETINDINSFFILYKKLEFGFMGYQTNDNNVNIEFKLSDPQNMGSYKKVPDVLEIVKKNYENWKSFEIFRPFLQALHIFQEIRIGTPLKDASADTSEQIEHTLLQNIETCQDKEAIIVACCLTIMSQQRQANLLIVEINNKIFYHLAKSILNAEYLFIKEYSLILRETVVQLLKNGTEKKLKGEEFRDIYPYTIRSFIKLAWYTEEICKHISRSLQDPATHLVSANTDREARFNALPQPNMFFGERNTLSYELLLESILDMTLIDHCYQTTGSNLEKLFLLFEREKFFNTLEGDKSDTIFMPIRIIARKKAATLLSQMLAQEKKSKANYNLKYYFNINSDTLWENYQKNIESECINEDVIKTNPWLNIKNRFKNIPISSRDIPTLINTQYGKDIELYNAAVNEGIQNYCELSFLIYKGNGQLHSAEFILAEFKRMKTQYENANKGKPIIEYCLQKFTPSAFIKILEILVNDIEKQVSVEKIDRIDEKNVEYIEKEIEQLKIFLDHLRVYIRVYNDSTPFLYRPPFEASFYSINNKREVSFAHIEKEDIIKYNYENYEKCFFFASLGCTPVNVEYLDFVHIYRNNERRKLSIEFQKLKNHTFNEKLKQTSKEVQKKGLEDAETKIQNLSNQLRHDTVQQLGIFATFLAFVTISLGMIKVAKNIQQYMIFCLSFTASLSFFVILIHRRYREFFSKNTNKNDNHKTNVFLPWLWQCFRDCLPILLLIILIIIGLSFMESKIFLKK